MGCVCAWLGGVLRPILREDTTAWETTAWKILMMGPRETFNTKPPRRSKGPLGKASMWRKHTQIWVLIMVIIIMA